MRNPFVIIIGIWQYDEPNSSLNGVKLDIDKMTELWRDYAGYEHVAVMPNGYVSFEDLQEYVEDRATDIQQNGKKWGIDGLILYILAMVPIKIRFVKSCKRN